MMGSIVAWACGAMLAAGALLSIARIVKGPTLLDRMLASDVLLVVVASALLLQMALTGDTANLVFVLLTALVGFLGSVTVARTVAAKAQAAELIEELEQGVGRGSADA